MPPFDFIPILAFCLVTSFLLVIIHRRRAKDMPYPPGPPGHLILGNVQDTSSMKPWLHFTELSKRYGI